MIHVIIGTKGQFIKMAPVLLELEKREIPYFFVQAGQHTDIIDYLIEEFKVKKPDFYFLHYSKDIINEKQIILWFIKNLLKFGLPNKEYSRFSPNDIVLLHGDAPPALLGLWIAKIKKMRIAHIEAGERTGNLFHPFPEEFIRIQVDKNSDIKFASSERSYNNLIKENLKRGVINIKENTLIDSVRIALNNGKNYDKKKEFILASIHRYETLANKKRMSIIIKTLNDFSKIYPIILPIHPSTENKMKKYGFLQKLAENENIEIRGLEPYFNFINLINNCKLMITDGGGPQQESYYLGKPCLLMRECVERPEFDNIFISQFNQVRINYFKNNFTKFETSKKIDEEIFPSKKVVDIIQREFLK